MFDLFQFIFLISLIIQGIYFIFCFSRLIFYQDPGKEKPSYEPGVSVVIAARNEKHNLTQLIPSLLRQEFPDFEIILVDDRSEDGTSDFIFNNFADSKLKVEKITHVPEGLNPKKNALTQGISKSTKEIILVTDADCVALSDQWIFEMVQGFTEGKEIVLGYSPYKNQPGFLNKLIRFETFYTAVQYLSFALIGSPYMGVGRNMAYKKSLFQKNKGFASHSKITGGDDDLLIKEISSKSNVSIKISPLSQTLSIPKTSYKDWFLQKRRHLSAGIQYKIIDKIKLGLLMGSQIGFYTSLIYFFLSLNLNIPIIIGFILRTVLIIIIFTLISGKLKERLKWYWFPVLDFFYVINYIIAGFAALISKNIKWT